MPTLTLRFEEFSSIDISLGTVKEIFNTKNNTTAIYKALEYTAGYNERRDRLNNAINRVQELEEELTEIKDMISRQNRLSEKIREYAEK